MSREIKVEMFDAKRIGHMIETFHMEQRADMFRDWRDPPRSHEVTRSVHPVHEVRLATQSIRVAFDPESHTLFVGETDWPGWVEVAAANAVARGDMNPFMREVQRAASQREYAIEDAKRSDEARAKHARVVMEATARLKSPKSGVRRRAKRLLEKLGR